MVCLSCRKACNIPSVDRAKRVKMKSIRKIMRASSLVCLPVTNMLASMSMLVLMSITVVYGDSNGGSTNIEYGNSPQSSIAYYYGNTNRSEVRWVDSDPSQLQSLQQRQEGATRHDSNNPTRLNNRHDARRLREGHNIRERSNTTPLHGYNTRLQDGYHTRPLRGYRGLAEGNEMTIADTGTPAGDLSPTVAPVVPPTFTMSTTPLPVLPKSDLVANCHHASSSCVHQNCCAKPREGVCLAYSPDPLRYKFVSTIKVNVQMQCGVNTGLWHYQCCVKDYVLIYPEWTTTTTTTTTTTSNDSNLGEQLKGEDKSKEEDASGIFIFSVVFGFIAIIIFSSGSLYIVHNKPRNSKWRKLVQPCCGWYVGRIERRERELEKAARTLAEAAEVMKELHHVGDTGEMAAVLGRGGNAVDKAAMFVRGEALTRHMQMQRIRNITNRFAGGAGFIQIADDDMSDYSAFHEDQSNIDGRSNIDETRSNISNATGLQESNGRQVNGDGAMHTSSRDGKDRPKRLMPPGATTGAPLKGEENSKTDGVKKKGGAGAKCGRSDINFINDLLGIDLNESGRFRDPSQERERGLDPDTQFIESADNELEGLDDLEDARLDAQDIYASAGHDAADDDDFAIPSPKSNVGKFAAAAEDDSADDPVSTGQNASQNTAQNASVDQLSTVHSALGKTGSRQKRTTERSTLSRQFTGQFPAASTDQRSPRSPQRSPRDSQLTLQSQRTRGT